MLESDDKLIDDKLRLEVDSEEDDKLVLSLESAPLIELLSLEKNGGGPGGTVTTGWRVSVGRKSSEKPTKDIFLKVERRLISKKEGSLALIYRLILSVIIGKFCGVILICSIIWIINCLFSGIKFGSIS